MKEWMKVVVFKILKQLNNIVSKENIFLFMSVPQFSDNVFCVFERIYSIDYFKNNYRFVWLLNKDDERLDKFDNVIGIKHHSLRGIYYFLRSKYVIHSHGLYMNATSKNQMVFSLWHGMPLKKVQHLFPKDMDSIANRNLRFTITIATSEMMARKVGDCFNCELEKVKVTGLPRNDLLFKCNKFKMIENDNKVIVWMPTYRDGINNFREGIQYIYGIPLLNQNNIFELNEYCKCNNVSLLIKLHPFQKAKVSFPAMSNILLIDSEIVDEREHFYSYLGSADALLTDYSSVYIDFLAVDKPIGFVLEDYKEYNDDRGFVFDKPFEYMPGVHIFYFEDLKRFICDIANGIDNTKNFRDTIGMKLNQFRDDKNTERFINEMIPIIKGDRAVE